MHGGKLDVLSDGVKVDTLSITLAPPLKTSLKHGTFGTIAIADTVSITAYDLLADGYAFYDASGVVQNGKVKRLTNVTVMQHVHTIEADGCKCGVTCLHPEWKNGVCTKCLEHCAHENIDSTYTCSTCGAAFAASLTANGSTAYYVGLADALNAAGDAGEVTLLRDTGLTQIESNGDESTVDADINTSQNGSVVLNLNGHSITAKDKMIKVGGGGGGHLTVTGGGAVNTEIIVYDGSLTLNAFSGMIDTVTIDYGSISSDEDTNWWIGTLNMPNDNSSGTLRSGTIGAIDAYSDTPTAGKLLESGYVFQDANGSYVAQTTPADGLTEVTVVACDHNGTNGFDIGSNACPYCGAPAVAQTALKGVEGNPWRNFADLQTALDSDRDGGSKLRLLADVTGEYYIRGTTYTGLALGDNPNAKYSINGTVHVTGSGGETTFNGTGCTVETVVAYAGAKLARSGAPAVIKTLRLADGATWENILTTKDLGYKVYTNYPNEYTWYDADTASRNRKTELHNVSIERLPIPFKTLTLVANGKEVDEVDRGTSVQLRAYCDTKDASVAFYIKKADGSQKESLLTEANGVKYEQIGTYWYYVVDHPFDETGEYNIYFTAISADRLYSVKSDTKTLTVTKMTIPDTAITAPTAKTLTYNGAEQELVTDGSVGAEYGTMQYSLNEKDWSSTIPTARDAGTYTVYYKVIGSDEYKDSAVKDVKVTIAPKELSFIDATLAEKIYDGTTDAVITGAEFAGLVKGDTLTLGTDYTAAGAFDNANAGDRKTVTATVTLTRNVKNYTLKNGGTLAMYNCTIKKATAPAATPGELYIYNDLAKTYEVELPALPTLDGSKTYGTITYGLSVNMQTEYYEITTAKIENSKLLLPIKNNPVATTGQVGTITISVTTVNFEDFDLTINVNSVNKTVPVPDGTISASGITYGDALSASTITGKMMDANTEVKGTFAWKDGTIKPNAGSYDAEWTFTPNAPEYAAATGNVTVTVNRKDIAGAVVTLEQVSFVYDGTRKDPVVSSVVLDGKTLVNGSSNDYGYNYDMASDAGTYTLNVTGNHNYCGKAAVTWSITPRTVTAPAITVSGAPFVYTGSAITPAVTVKDDLGNTVDPKEYTVSCKDNTNAGTATITITDNAGGNYTVSGSKTFTIAKAASALATAPAAKTGLSYNGKEQELITAGTATGGTVKYRLGTTGEFSAAIPKAANAGEYTVYYFVEGDANHNSQKEVQSVTVSIAKAAVTVTAANKSAFVGDAVPDLSKPVEGTDYTVSGLFGTDKLTGTVKLAYVDANGNAVTPSMAATGETLIRASGVTAPNENYTLAFADGKLTVSVRPTYIITATAGLHGSISPVGSVSVIHGGSRSFTITPDAGYAIANVRIDGASIGAAKYYTFENVTSAHTIEAVFMRVNGNPQTGVMVDEVDGSYYESAWQGE